MNIASLTSSFFFFLCSLTMITFIRFSGLWFCDSSFRLIYSIDEDGLLASIAKLTQQFRSVIVAIVFYRTYLSIELGSSAFNTHITCIILNIHAIILFLIVHHYRDTKAIIKFSLSLGDRQQIIFNAKFAPSVKKRKTLCVTILKKTFNLSALNFFLKKRKALIS